MSAAGQPWRAVGETHVGRREHNEDALLIEPATGLVMVADGVGGHQAGEVASQITCEVLARELAAGKDLESAIRQANREVRQAVDSGRGKSGMATTVVAAQFDGAAYQLCWVGDSRAYLWDGQLKLLTRDHSYVEALLEQGQITFEEARSHPRKNVIVQAIGLQDEDKLRVGGNRGNLPPGAVLVLCSDGLSDVLDCDHLAALLGSGESLQARSEALVQAAVEAGGRDNVTVVLVELDSDPDAAFGEGASDTAAGSSAAEGVAAEGEPEVVWRYDPATGDYHGLPELVQPGLPSGDGAAESVPARAAQRQRVRPKSVESTQLMSADAMDELRQEAQKQYRPSRGRRRLWLLLTVLLGALLGYWYSTGLGG